VIYADGPVSSGQMSTYLEWAKEHEAEINAVSLKLYIDSLPSEWGREPKLCTDDVDYAVRKSVAAHGNDRGGEIFVGVGDGREIRGTEVQADRLAHVLRQENAPRSAWFTSDLTRALREVTPVPTADGKRAFVLETSQQALPLLVHDRSGKLWIHARNGSESARLSGFDALLWYRSRRRAEILRTVYAELRIMSERFVPWSLFPPPTFAPPPVLHGDGADRRTVPVPRSGRPPGSSGRPKWALSETGICRAVSDLPP
jgi:hypothetical protein